MAQQWTDDEMHLARAEQIRWARNYISRTYGAVAISYEQGGIMRRETVTARTRTWENPQIIFRDEMQPNGPISPEPPPGEFHVTRSRVVIGPSAGAVVHIWYQLRAEGLSRGSA